MGYYTVTRTATGTRIVEKDLGYELIPVCRPNFIFFKFTNLRPQVPHWIFFDGEDVTKWVNTSYAYSDYDSQDRDSKLKDPGDDYISATAFPSSLGGPTSASGPVYTNSNGTLEGVLYLQSNETTSFKTGKRLLTAIDISVLRKADCLSFDQGEYKAIGENELYKEVSETYTYTYTEQVYYSDNSNDGWQPTPGGGYTSSSLGMCYGGGFDAGDIGVAPGGFGGGSSSGGSSSGGSSSGGGMSSAASAAAAGFGSSPGGEFGGGIAGSAAASAAANSGPF